MKNLKRLYAMILAMAMVVATMATPVAATESTIIDTSKKASMTVHKYKEDTMLDLTGYKTQKEMEDYIASLGGQITPLADVTFRYVRIGSVKQYTKNDTVTIGYSVEDKFATLLGLKSSDVDYTVGGTKYYSVSTLDKALNKVSATKVEQYISNNPGHVDMAATNASGTATASNLDLGLYLLCEYSYLANTVGNEQHGHSVPALIPLPLTDHTPDGTYSWEYDVDVYPKNIVQDITIDKVILGNNNNETKQWDTQIGDHVEYLIRTDVPHAIGKLQTYTVNDTLAKGLDYDTGTYIVNGVDAAGKRTLLTDPANFTFTSTDTHTFSWAFKPSTLADNEGWAKYDSIEIYYTATLNKDAIVGGAGNLNECSLDISRVTNTDTAPIDTYVPTELPRAYTYALDLTKYGDSANTKPLEGTIWEIQNAGEQPLKVSEQVPGTPGAYYIDPNGQATLTTDANGKLYIKGLQAGTYYLKEVATNNGYSLLAEKIKIVITSNENTYTKDANGTYAPIDNTKRYRTNETYEDVGTDTVSKSYNWFALPTIPGKQTIVPSGTYVNFNVKNVYTADGKKVEMYRQNPLEWSCNYNMGTDATGSTGVVALTVNDQVIFELPHTGGIGKYFVIASGCIMLAAAATMIVVFKKRKGSEQCE